MSEESPKTSAEKKPSDKTSVKRRDASFEIILDGKICLTPLPCEVLDALSRQLGETMSFYYSQHTDEYSRMCDEGIMQPLGEKLNDAKKDTDNLQDL